MSIGKSIKRIASFILAAAMLLPMLASGALFGFSAKAEDELIYMSLPGFESQSNFSLALSWRSNLLTMRLNTSLHPDTTEKSMEIAVTTAADGSLFSEFSFASSQVLDSSIIDYMLNGHAIPRKGTSIFGDVPLHDAEGLSFWVGNYPTTGKIKIQLLTAPSKGPILSGEEYSDYDTGFVFESAEVSPVDDYVTFPFDSFRIADWWTKTDIYSNLSKINIMRVILLPGGGVSAGTKYQFADLRAYKTAEDYSWDITDADVVDRMITVNAVAGSAEASLSLRIDGSTSGVSLSEQKLNGFGETAVAFAVDTEQLTEGKKTITLLDGDNIVKTATVWVDNKLPHINASDKNASVISNLIYEVEHTDDSALIRVSDMALTEGSEVKYYLAETLPITTYQNLTDLPSLSAKTPEGETAMADSDGGYLTTSSSDGSVPYQSFEIDVAGISGSVNIEYKGNTTYGEKLMLSAYSPSLDEWVELERAECLDDDIIFNTDVPVDSYAENGKIKLRVSMLLVGNGSDSIAWASDPQHYLEGGINSPLQHYYETMLNWFKSEYRSGNITYICNTGDIVQNLGNNSEYAYARQLHNIIDADSIPNGVTPGNHDVGSIDRTKNYPLWKRYFGRAFYDNNDWFGDSWEDNTNWYQLITIGGHDFIFMYLGLDYEATPETVPWINRALKKYSHRTAVILTHQYLDTNGQVMAADAPDWKNSHGAAIREYIINPNENVKLVLCGHVEGSGDAYYTTYSGNRVVELLSDYQAVNDGGKGFFRYLVFGDSTITSRAYSASYPSQTSYSGNNAKENFTRTISYAENTRSINTAHMIATVSMSDTELSDVTSHDRYTEIRYDGEILPTTGWYGVITYPDGRECRSVVFPMSEKALDVGLKPTKGDLDSDSFVTVSDALISLRIVVGLIAPDAAQVELADVDGDKSVTVSDALLILKAAVEIIPGF